MAVTPDFREFAREQLEQVRSPVTIKAMFGGAGVYYDGLFFALLDDDTLYFKVDDSNRGDYEELGLGPFDPYKDGVHLMQYYPVPGDVLEDPDRLRPWMEKALAVAARAKEKKGRRGRTGK